MGLTKVAQTTLQAIVSVASNDVNIGAEVDVSTYYAGNFRIRMGRGTGSAFTTAPIIRLEGCYKTSSPTANDWVTLEEWQCAAGGSIASQAVSGTEAAGQTTITLAAGTNFAGGDYVFFHNTTLGNSEWSRVKSVSGADIVLHEGLVNAQTGSTCRDQAEQYHALVDLTCIEKIRLVVDAYGSGQAVIIEAVFGAVSALS